MGWHVQISSHASLSANLPVSFAFSLVLDFSYFCHNKTFLMIWTPYMVGGYRIYRSKWYILDKICDSSQTSYSCYGLFI